MAKEYPYPYRVTTDGQRFRVETHQGWWPFKRWVPGLLTYDTLEGAELWIALRVDERNRPESEWRTV